MKIVVAGGTGFVGSPLVAKLGEGHEVKVLTRKPSSVPNGVGWGEGQGDGWKKVVAEADAVINLAGENIGEGRWTEDRKKALVQSRLDATRRLVAVLRSEPRPQRVLVSASAVGYYGQNRADELLNEEGGAGTDFLARLCTQWEQAATEAEGAARVAILRFGVVLAPGGGVLGRLVPLIRLFAGGKAGSGRQWVSWVDRADVVKAITWAIEKGSGVYNVTAPNPVTNDELTQTLARVLHRPAIAPAPAFALRLALGEMADGLLLASQRVLPAHLQQEGFTFASPQLEPALQAMLAK